MGAGERIAGLAQIEDVGRERFFFRFVAGERRHEGAGFVHRAEEGNHAALAPIALAIHAGEVLHNAVDACCAMAAGTGNHEHVLPCFDLVLRRDGTMFHVGGVGEHSLALQETQLVGAHAVGIHVVGNDPWLAHEFPRPLEVSQQPDAHEGGDQQRPAGDQAGHQQAADADEEKRAERPAKERGELVLPLDESHREQRHGLVRTHGLRDQEPVPDSEKCERNHRGDHQMREVLHHPGARRCVLFGEEERAEPQEHGTRHECERGAETELGQIERSGHRIEERPGLAPIPGIHHKAEHRHDERHGDPRHDAQREADLDVLALFLRRIRFFPTEEPPHDKADLRDEDEPLQKPSEEKHPQQAADGKRREQRGGKPDTHSSQRPHGGGDDEDDKGDAISEAVNVRAVVLVRPPFHESKQRICAHGKGMIDEDVYAGDQSDDQTPAGDVVDEVGRVVHAMLLTQIPHP